MVRDISAGDIVAGNRKSNFREVVEARLTESGDDVDEIRFREISTQNTRLEDLQLETVAYETNATHERFLQFVTPEHRIAGFLRLSLPKHEYLIEQVGGLPISEGEAMIREVHVYGRAMALHQTGSSVQHLGLGRTLIEAAAQIAREQGYHALNVISSVGTRQYYARLGFADAGLYQQMGLGDKAVSQAPVLQLRTPSPCQEPFN
jgi:elongator complex protein 3